MCLWAGSEELMGSGGMGAVLYDWEPMKEGWQLLPSVWWDVTREGLAHSLLHAPLGSGLLFGWLAVGGLLQGSEGRQRVREAASLCLDQTFSDSLR